LILAILSCPDGKPALGLTRILTDSAKKNHLGKKFWRIIIKQELTLICHQSMDGIEG
jgi:hypothetical protein